MMNKKISLVFFGNEQLATGTTAESISVRALFDSGYEIKAIVINRADRVSRKDKEPKIVLFAREQNIPVLSPEKLNDVADVLSNYKADIGILVAYGRIIPQSIINIFPSGIVNVHPSLLPKHRGPTPIESTILDNDIKTGVSIMSLVAKMDSGPVYAQEEITLNKNESKISLTNTLHQIGTNILIKNLPQIVSRELSPTEQDNAQATYDHLISKQDGQIDWKKTATQLEREIRAYAGWPKSTTQLGSIDCVITKTSVIDKSGTPSSLFIEDKKLGVYCGENALVIEIIKPAGKKEMSSSAFLAGYKQRLNI